MKDAFLIGSKLYLRPLRESDIEGNYPNWFNDAETCKFNAHGRYPYTKEKALEYIQRLKSDKSIVALAIVDQKTEAHIGNICIQNIEPIDRCAEIAIILGEKDYWNKGYAREAWALMIEYGFNVLNLHRLQCGTFDGNVGLSNVALACGMKEEGRFKDGAYKNGKYVDVLYYGIINHEG